jgi:hypothetical protein
MMPHRGIAALISAIVMSGLFAPGAAADGGGLHPVFAWHGNEFLFEVRRDGALTRLTGYRALGERWERVGSTTIRDGQRGAEQGFLQKIWFNGRRIGALRADMNNPFWRVLPGLEHGDRVIP